MIKWSALLVILLTATTGLSEEIKSEFKKSFSKNCDTAYTLTCLKLDIVSWVEKLNEEDNYNLLPGISIVKENETFNLNTADIVADLAREFPNDPEARLDQFLMRKVTKFINNHSIKLKLWNDNGIDAASARKGGGGGGGGKDKGGGGLGYLLAAGAMMKGALMAIAMGALAALAGKALMAALMSLVLSALAAFKGSGGGGGKTTYEVVAKPVYTSSHSHSVAHEDYGGGGHAGYGRSFGNHPLPLGLQPDYKPGN
ncbi:hypothetical protein ABEB36_010205 [Hypothenemus hampei]|uniref:Uncharacterized protein n=1 Tax=Hypothenemus hampei TaxID=57062 RepID=A0ABD1EJ30_HYPHA